MNNFGSKYEIQFVSADSVNNHCHILDKKSYYLIKLSIEINKFRTRKPYKELHEPMDEFYQRDDFAERVLLGNICVYG